MNKTLVLVIFKLDFYNRIDIINVDSHISLNYNPLKEKDFNVKFMMVE